MMRKQWFPKKIYTDVTIFKKSDDGWHTTTVMISTHEKESWKRVTKSMNFIFDCQLKNLPNSTKTKIDP